MREVTGKILESLFDYAGPQLVRGKGPILCVSMLEGVSSKPRSESRIKSRKKNSLGGDDRSLGKSTLRNGYRKEWENRQKGRAKEIPRQKKDAYEEKDAFPAGLTVD